jgi:hypothetical protein
MDVTGFRQAIIWCSSARIFSSDYARVIFSYCIFALPQFLKQRLEYKLLPGILVFFKQHTTRVCKGPDKSKTKVPESIVPGARTDKESPSLQNLNFR